MNANMSHLYPLWCNREQSNLGVESSIMLNIFSEELFSKDTGKCMFVSVSFPLQVPCWESLSQPSCRASRGCLQYLCVSGLLAHLERILIGEFPILVSWRNLQVDFEILQRIIFYSLYRFFKFDSITLKFLFTFVHKLNFTITLLIKQQWSGLVCKQKHLIRKNPEALIWISWFFICIALNFVSLDLFLLFIGNASILLPFCKNENFVESVWVCTHKYVLEYIYMCIACAVVESLCLIMLDPSVTEQLKYRKVAEKKPNNSFCLLLVHIYSCCDTSVLWVLAVGHSSWEGDKGLYAEWCDGLSLAGATHRSAWSSAGSTECSLAGKFGFPLVLSWCCAPASVVLLCSSPFTPCVQVALLDHS